MSGMFGIRGYLVIGELSARGGEGRGEANGFTLVDILRPFRAILLALKGRHLLSRGEALR